MNRRTHKIRRALTAIALSATAALLVIPMAQARDRIVDDWFRGTTAAQPQSPQPGNLLGDYMFRDYLRNASKANDNILDVSARDRQIGPIQPGNLRGDFMFRNYLLSARTTAAQANDNILDVSSRDAGTVASVEATPSSGTDWHTIGLGMTVGGVLLLLIAVAAGLEVRHIRHLGSA